MQAQNAQRAGTVRRHFKVQRDMDLIRTILLAIDQNQQMDGSRDFFITDPEQLGITDHSIEQTNYHLDLLISGGFVNGAPRGHIVRGLTWSGHEFLDSIKDAGIWQTTKERLSGLPTITLKVFAHVAEALGEAAIKKHLGL
jgi:hypothetical protein